MTRRALPLLATVAGLALGGILLVRAATPRLPFPLTPSAPLGSLADIERYASERRFHDRKEARTSTLPGMPGAVRAVEFRYTSEEGFAAGRSPGLLSVGLDRDGVPIAIGLVYPAGGGTVELQLLSRALWRLAEHDPARYNATRSVAGGSVTLVVSVR